MEKIDEIEFKVETENLKEDINKQNSKNVSPQKESNKEKKSISRLEKNTDSIQPKKPITKRMLTPLIPLVKRRPILFKGSRFLTEISTAIPEFPLENDDFSTNHKCDRVDTFQCDNSLNFVTKCTEDNFSRCPLQSLLLDCRKNISYFFFQKFIGGSALKMSTFGTKSKCVKIKKRRKRQEAVCLRTFCHISRTSYIILVPDQNSNSFYLFRSN